jgi:hypothetical protein
VQHGTGQNEIINRVCIEINGKLGEDEKRAKSIIEAYKSISGGQAPILIIPAGMRYINDKPAALTDSGRILTEEYKLNVIIDACENAMSDQLTLREDILYMKPMTDELMRKLPQFEKLFHRLNETQNDQVVLAVSNGCPALLRDLNSKLNYCVATDRDSVIREVVKFVNAQLAKASGGIYSLIESCPKISEVCERQVSFLNYTKVKTFNLI